jgi:hypothetical protein
VRSVNVNAQSHIEGDGWSRFGIGGGTTDIDRATHPPVIDSAPARAEECVDPWLIKAQSYIRDFAGLNIYRLHVHLTDGSGGYVANHGSSSDMDSCHPY